MDVRVVSESDKVKYAAGVAKAFSEMESKAGIFVSFQHAMAQGTGGTVYYSSVLVFKVPDPEPEPEPEAMALTVNGN